MGPLIEYFDNEHRRLREEAEVLRQAAADAEHRQALHLRHEVTAAHEFLFQEVLPFQAVEERYLLPAIEHHLGAAAAAELRADHVELGRLAADLGALRDHLGVDPVAARDVIGLERALYAAYELLRLHLMKEDGLLAEAEPGLHASQQEILDRLLESQLTV
jgi:hemerythrin HHE cation binding domain-containing protein